MATIDQLKEGLNRAAAAGDDAAAREIAALLKTQTAVENPAPSAAAAGISDTARQTGVGEALLVGAGRGTDKIVQGARQLWNEGLTRVGSEPVARDARATLDTMATAEKEKDAIYKGLKSEHPFAASIGESAPLLAIPGGAGILTQAGLGAAIGGAKYGSATDRVKEALMDGAGAGAGALAGKAIGNVIAPVNREVVNATKREAMKDAIALGVKPRLSQVTGSPTMARIEDAAARVPGGAGVMEDFAAKNARAFNEVAARSVGQKGNEMTGQVFNDAHTALGKVFNDIKALPGNVIKIDRGVGTAADDILRQQAKMIPSQQDPALIKLATEAKQMAAGNAKMDGERYQLVRSGLSEASYDATGTTRTHYGKLLEALDNSAEASLNAIGRKDLAESLRTVRPQYANLMTLEKGKVTQGGNVNPELVAAAMRQNNPGAFRRGSNQSELADVARYGEAFPALRAGSQTFERQTVTNPFAAAILAGPAYIAANAATNPIVTGYARNIGGTAAAAGVGEAANRSTRSVIDAMMQQYLNPLRTQ